MTYFLLDFDIPLPPASSSSSISWGFWFSFSSFLGGPPKKSPMPFCQDGVGRGHTGFPPAYLFFAAIEKKQCDLYYHFHSSTVCIMLWLSLSGWDWPGVEAWLLDEELAELAPRDFRGAEAATATNQTSNRLRVGCVVKHPRIKTRTAMSLVIKTITEPGLSLI